MGVVRDPGDSTGEAIEPPRCAQDVLRTRPELPDARNLLSDAGETPEEVHARIASGDPLDLYPLCGVRIRERSLLLDADRVFGRALAVVAVSTVVEREDRGSGPWLLDKVDRAIRLLLQEDQEQERSATPADDDSAYLFLVDAFAIERALARTAAVRFNNLDERARRVFFRLLVDGASVETCLTEGLGDRKSMREDALRTLCALGYINDEELREMLTRKRR